MIEREDLSEYRVVCARRAYSRAYMRGWHARNPGKNNLHKKPPVTWQKIMLDNARQRAKRKNVPCTITLELLLSDEKCPCCGAPFRDTNGPHQPTSRSLDRINPALGYVPGNVEIICYRCNTIKQNATAEELELVAAFIRKRTAT